jgi:nucleoside 2-deoxyribosyltransferase
MEFDCNIANNFPNDPLFHNPPSYASTDAEMDPEKAPLLFNVNKYRYLLADPSLVDDKDFCSKAAIYIFYHFKDNQDSPLVFFFGDPKQCEEIQKGFSNQTIQIVSRDLLEAWYPKTLNEMAQMIIEYLLNFQDHFGGTFQLSRAQVNLLTFTSFNLIPNAQDDNREFILRYLIDQQYIMASEGLDSGYSIQILSKAINDFKLGSEKDNNKRVFIALKFGDNSERIENIERILRKLGYIPEVMSEYETNNWIMPEIFHAIKECKFAIADFSLPCDGAYYEAGYALALGKEVIHLCQEDSFKNIHFDIAQKSTIVYKDFSDLEKRLTDRIIATIK